MDAMRAHWAAALFPMLSLDELGELARDIKAHGLREPIEALDGEIMDGRNRHAACDLANVKPRFVDAPDYARADPVAYVISKNLRRRHLDESQRAMVAAKLREEWKKRGDAAPQLGGESADTAAKLLNVGRGSVERAAKVLSSAQPELVAAVEAGKVAVSAAAAIADLPAEEQRAAAADPKAAKAKAREVREARAAVPKPAPALKPDEDEPAQMPELDPESAFADECPLPDQRNVPPHLAKVFGPVALKLGEASGHLVAALALWTQVEREITRASEAAKRPLVPEFAFTRARDMALSSAHGLSVLSRLLRDLIATRVCDACGGNDAACSACRGVGWRPDAEVRELARSAAKVEAKRRAVGAS